MRALSRVSLPMQRASTRVESVTVVALDRPEATQRVTLDLNISMTNVQRNNIR